MMGPRDLGALLVFDAFVGELVETQRESLG
jgi:hypothetical protein